MITYSNIPPRSITPRTSYIPVVNHSQYIKPTPQMYS